jgi:hypothetical protein
MQVRALLASPTLRYPLPREESKLLVVSEIKELPHKFSA